MTEVMKTCTKCGVAKGLPNFYRHKTGKFGVKPSCIDCTRKYNAENASAINAYMRDYYEKNKRRICERSARWRVENRERYLSFLRNYWKQNRGELLVKSAVYQRKRVDDLSRQYVANCLAQRSSISARDIPDTLIDAHTVHLKIKRLLRQRKQA